MQSVAGTATSKEASYSLSAGLLPTGELSQQRCNGVPGPSKKGCQESDHTPQLEESSRILEQFLVSYFNITAYYLLEKSKTSSRGKSLGAASLGILGKDLGAGQ